MAVVTLKTLTLNLASDLSQVWTFPLLSSLQSQPAKNVTDQEYAGGNRRMVATKGRQNVVSVVLTAISPAERQLLEVTLHGVLLCVRDDRGRKFYGYYVDPQVTEHPYDSNCDMTLTFKQISVSEVLAA